MVALQGKAMKSAVLGRKFLESPNAEGGVAGPKHIYTRSLKGRQTGSLLSSHIITTEL